MPSLARLFKRFHAGYNLVPEIHGKSNRVSLLVGKAQLAGCVKVCLSVLLEGDAGIQQPCAKCRSGHY